MDKVLLYDVTLRDGAQTQGVSFSVQDKIRIAHQLDEIGIDFIEGGWPGSNPKDTEFYQLMKKEKLQNSVLVAFGSTRRAINKAEDDPVLRALVESEAEQLNIFAKGWDFHVEEALKISLQENLDLVFDSIRFLKKYTDRVTLGIEHFFDGYKANPDYVKKLLKTIEEAGAYWIGVADTNGGCLPGEIEKILTEGRSITPLLRVVHLHNDTGLAVANSIKAIQCGADVIHGTINGVGERCGMVDFCTLIPTLKLKYGLDCVTSEQLMRMREIAFFVARCGGFQVSKFSPYVGQNAFYHKSEEHVQSVLQNEETYNHVSPEVVGNKFLTSVSEKTGEETIQLLAEKYGMSLDSNDSRIGQLNDYFKQKEKYGLNYEGAAASQYLIFKNFLGGYTPQIVIEEYDFRIEKISQGKTGDVLDEKILPSIEVFIKMTVGNRTENISISDNKGPLSALATAFKCGINKFFDDLGESLCIKDLQISVLDFSTGGEGFHRIKLLLSLLDLETNEMYNLVSESHEVYSAFLRAFADGYEYKLLKRNEENNG